MGAVSNPGGKLTGCVCLTVKLGAANGGGQAAGKAGRVQIGQKLMGGYYWFRDKKL
jgi:hypothetical protein